MPEESNITALWNQKVERRQVLKAGVAALAGLALAPARAQELSSRPPNIVLIVLDALRAATLPMYGNPRNTAPFMDQLAKQAVLFEHCYSTTTWTKPAVASLLTGVPPLTHKVINEKTVLPPGLPTFPQSLGRLGYKTAFINSNPFLAEGFGADQSFTYVSHAAATERDYGLRICFETENWLKTLSGEPVFAYLHFMPPHGPYNPPGTYVDRIRRLGRPSESFLRPEHRDVDINLSNHGLGRIPWYQAGLGWSNDPLFYLTLYEAHTLFGDYLVSDLFNRWERLRRGERTVFIISSDHGEGLGDHGLFCDHGKFLADPLLHVPLLVYDTARPEGRTIKEVVSHLDFAASILELAGSGEMIGAQPRKIFYSMGEQGGDYAALHQEVGASAEDGWALTQGQWRLVYNDCPHYGNTNILEIVSADPAPLRGARVPFELPKTALRRPQSLAPGVVLENLALHTAHAEKGKTYPFSGQVHLEKGREGALKLRAVGAAMEETLLGDFACKVDWVDIIGALSIPGAGNGDCHTVHIEAGWVSKSHEDPANAPPCWKRLFSFPLFETKALSKEILLLGVEIAPAVVCAGGAVNISYTWRSLENPGYKLGLHTEFVDAAGEVAFEFDHVFHRNPEDKDGKFMPSSKLRKGFRFTESFWVNLPPKIKPGSYEVRVGAYDRKDPSFRTPLVSQGSLEVARTPKGTFQILVKQDRGLEHFNMLWEDPLTTETQTGSKQEATVKYGLEQMANRFPEEGQIDFLNAAGEDDPAKQEALLRQCLGKVPFHRRALLKACEKPWGEEFKKTAKVLAPPRRCAFDFQGLFNLYGFDAKRAPAGAFEPAVYLTLYWEAMSSMTLPYSTGLTLGYYGPEDFSSTHWIWWFLGAAVRATYRWKIGEAIKEKIYVPLLEDIEEVSFALRPDSHWTSLYTEKINPLYLTIVDESGKKKAYASLGRFKLDELPVSGEDLLQKKRESSQFYQLYDLKSDPGERDNLIDARPELFEAMKPKLLAMMKASEVPLAQDQQPEEAEISEETLEALRALGYIK